ncbi:MAG: mechanosensitive ion channel family protein [Bacteroidetes bacterium]|nr:MAG: mechanosensitive ion channel family protein [Bacteroidota bacterium]
MQDLLKHEYVLFGLALVSGSVLGYILIRPIFRLVKKRAQQKQLPYLSLLMESLSRISVLIGFAIVLNLFRLEIFAIIPSARLVVAIQVITTLITTYVFGELLVFIYDGYSQAKANAATSLYHILIRIFVYSSGLLVVFNILNIEIAPILTALGVGGLAVALALQDTLSNLFAGVHILAARQLKPGDYIRLDSGEEGYVVDINWRNTEIKTLLENIVIIPNSKIASSVTTNYCTNQKNLYFHVIVGVHYDTDLELAEREALTVAREILQEVGRLSYTFEPRVRFFEFADSSINMRVWLAADIYENQHAIRHAFIKRLKKRFDQVGIVIPFPIRTVYLN